MTAPARVTLFAGVATILVALSLTPVFATATWFWHSLGAAIVIGLVGAGMRRTSAPSLVVILVQLLAIFVYLGWLYSDDTIYGLLPGPGVVQDFGTLLRTGLADADTYSPKVPETNGLLLLTVGGVALINLAVDAAAATFRRASLAGLPLLALYTVPASILEDGIPWPLFLLGALGFIGLLIAEGQERLVRWGRPLVAGLSAERAGRAIGPSKVDTTPFGQVGRRIGAVVIGLAIIVPALLPVTDGLLSRGAGGLSVSRTPRSRGSLRTRTRATCTCGWPRWTCSTASSGGRRSRSATGSTTACRGRSGCPTRSSAGRSSPRSSSPTRSRTSTCRSRTR